MDEERTTEREKNLKTRVPRYKWPLSFWGAQEDSEGDRAGRWEYCEVLVTLGGEITGNTAEAIYCRDEGEHERVYEAKFGRLLARLGEEGWEMVSASARPGIEPFHKHRINYIFKRPKMEG